MEYLKCFNVSHLLLFLFFSFPLHFLGHCLDDESLESVCLASHENSDKRYINYAHYNSNRFLVLFILILFVFDHFISFFSFCSRVFTVCVRLTKKKAQNVWLLYLSIHFNVRGDNFIGDCDNFLRVSLAKRR